jgi:hypothetical protein
VLEDAPVSLNPNQVNYIRACMGIGKGAAKKGKKKQRGKQNNIFFHGPTSPSGPRPPHYRGFMITLRNTTRSKTLLEE